MATLTPEKDVEAAAFDGRGEKQAGVDASDGSVVDEVARARSIQNRFAAFRYMRQAEEWLDAKLGIESQGIDRIPEEDKKPPSILNCFFMWCSMTCHVGTIPIGVLSAEFGLSFRQAVAAIITGTWVGALCTAYCGTLGPKLGLRAIATSRYSFGFWGAKLCSVLNILVGGGFAVVNVVICGQILSAVSDYTMTISVGCVIITVISYVVSIFGFSMIHTFEKYSWIMAFILICVLIGQAAPHVDSALPAEESGLSLAGEWLSYFAVCFSSASGWCSIASDYYCNYPATTKSWKVFMLTLWGVTFPTIFVTIIGAALGNAALDVAYPPYNEAYNDHGLGGLILTIYHPIGWSKFALVMLMFSVLGNNIAIFYSNGLSLQLLGHWFHAIPRFIWSLLVAVVIGVLAVVGKDHLSTIVDNFVSLLGYWTVSFTLILLMEDKWFRRHEGYNLTVWDQVGGLPWGAAATLALLAGYLAGGVTGMAQTWYVGPIAKYFDPVYGGDVGIYLSAAITVLVYPIARTIERKYTGR